MSVQDYAGRRPDWAMMLDFAGDCFEEACTADERLPGKLMLYNLERLLHDFLKGTICAPYRLPRRSIYVQP